MVAEMQRQGLTGNEIAKQMGMRPASVRNIISRLRRRGEELPRFYGGRVAGRTLQERVLAIADGRSIAEIAERLGISQQSVRSAIKALRRAGHTIRTVRGGRTRQEQVLALVEEGMTPAEMAKALGVTPNAVRCALFELRRQGHEVGTYQPRAGTVMAAIVDGALAGKSAQAIAEELGVSVNNVHASLSMARRNGMAIPSLARPSAPLWPEVVALLAGGMTRKEVATALGVTESYVRSAKSRAEAQGDAARTPVIEPEERAAILEKLRAGTPPTAAARELHLPLQRVVWVGRHAGLRWGPGLRPKGPKMEKPEAPRDPFPVTVRKADMVMFAQSRGIAWNDDRESVGRVNRVRNEMGLPPMWVHPRELRA